MSFVDHNGFFNLKMVSIEWIIENWVGSYEVNFGWMFMKLEHKV